MKPKHISHRITSIILSILMLTSMLVLPQSAAVAVQASAETLTQAPSGGHATTVPEGYTAVRTMEDLYAIRSNPTGNFILMNDIDMSGTAPGGEWDGGNGWTPIPTFSGIFDGNGYTLSNLNCYGTISTSGFITSNSGTINNLIVKDMTVSGNISSFGFVGTNSGTLSDLHFEDINADIDTGSAELYFGTVASYNRGTISLCSVTGNVKAVTTSIARIGGITGYNAQFASGNINWCYNKANITVTGRIEVSVGGIAGTSSSLSTIENSYNTAKISAQSDTVYCGGIIGYNYRTIYKCLNFVDGRIYGSSSYSITDCYCLAGSTFGDGGTELTASLMKQQASYLEFGFNAYAPTWEMFNGKPQLVYNPEFIPTKVTIKQKPSKIIYNAGEEFTVDGKLEVTCKDGTVGTVDITPRMVNGCTRSEGSQNVTITYRDYSVMANVPVEINEEIPDGYTPIYNIEQLYAIRQNPSYNYILMNDIDMSATAPGGEWDGGNGWVPISIFSGTLNGNGYVLSNMYLYGNIENSGFINENQGTITDLHFEDVNVDINSNAETFNVGVVASKNNGTINFCSVTGNTIVTATGNVYIGGIAGINADNKVGTINYCYNKTNITVSGGNKAYVGGIVGKSCNTRDSIVTNCYNTGNISTQSAKNICGGIAGDTFYNIQKSINFVYGRITGNGGGSDCYCLTGSSFGNGGTELTAALMKQQASYLDFDFTDTWEMYHERPRLKNNPEEYVTQIKFAKRPTKLTFYQGDTFETDGQLTVTYTNDSTRTINITSSMVSGYDMNEIGSQTVTVTYREQTIDYQINVLEISVKDLSLSKTESTLNKGDTETLKATLTPENATNKTITWSTTDDKIAAVDENGKVTAIAPGKATITATTSNGKKATCTVTVIIPADNVTLNKNYAPIYKGETLTLVPTVTPSDSTDKLTWASSDESVATVDNTGKVTAKGAGTANITATADSGVFASCFVEVSSPVKALTLSAQSLDMIAGGNEVLNLTVDPSDTTDDIEWSASSDVIGLEVSSDKRTATVYANHAGNAEITVTSSSGVETTCTVSVIRNADSISFNEYYKTLEKGSTYTLKPILDPADSSDKITWHSDNTSAVTVDTNGKITAVGKGTANVSAQILNGQTATVAVTVIVSPTSIELDKDSIDIVGSNSTQLFAVIAPDDADKEVTWSSSNRRCIR